MQESFRILVKYAGQVGLKINGTKTKFMRINTTVPCNLEINCKTIDEVENFCYLQSILAKNSGADLDVQNRIQKARQGLISLNIIWNYTQLTKFGK